MRIGPPRVARKVTWLYSDLGEGCPLSENGRASSAELSRITPNPPVYRPFLPLRLFPNAGASENCDVAALFTLPLISSPSEGVVGTAASSAGAGFSVALLSFGFVS